MSYTRICVRVYGETQVFIVPSRDFVIIFVPAEVKHFSEAVPSGYARSRHDAPRVYYMGFHDLVFISFHTNTRVRRSLSFSNRTGI